MAYALPYCFVGILMLFLGLKLSPCNDKITNKYAQRYILFSIWIYFIGFRGFIVTDWRLYYPRYNEFPTFFNSSISYCLSFASNHHWETGYVVFAMILKSLGANYFIYQAISLIIDIVILTYIFDEYCNSNYLPLYFFIYYVFQGFVIETNLMRNSKAIMLFLISIKYVNQKDFKRFFLLNLLGYFFHKSTIFYFPLYFVLNKKFSTKFLWLVFLIGNIIFLMHIKIIGGAVDIAVKLLQGTSFDPMLRWYGLTSGNFTGYDLGLGFLERTLTFVMTLKLQNKILKKDINLLPFFNLMYLYIFTYLYLSEINILVSRISMLFVITYPVIYGNIYDKLSKKNKIIFLIFVGAYGILKMLVQCDEPNYLYENYLLTEPNFSKRLLLTH